MVANSDSQQLMHSGGYPAADIIQQLISCGRFAMMSIYTIADKQQQIYSGVPPVTVVDTTEQCGTGLGKPAG
jgi:hypothetical protein